MAISFEQFSALRDKGLSVDDIQRFSGMPRYETETMPTEKGGLLNGMANFSQDVNMGVQNVAEDFMRTPEQQTSTMDNMVRPPGTLNRVADTITNVGKSVAAIPMTKAIHKFSSTPFQPETRSKLDRIQGIMKKVGSVVGGPMAGIANINPEIAAKTVGHIATPTIGFGSDMINQGYKAAYAARDLAFPRKDQPLTKLDTINRAFTNDRSTGTVMFDQGEEMMPQQIAKLKAEGKTDEEISKILTSEQFIRGMGGDTIDYFAAPAVARKWSKSNTAKSFNRSAKHLKNRFKRPEGITEGVELGAPQGELALGAGKGKPSDLFKAPKKSTPVIEEAGGQKKWSFKDARKPAEENMEFDFSKKVWTEPIKRGSGQKTFRFEKKGVKPGTGIKSPTVPEKSVPVKTPKAAVHTEFKTGQEPKLLDYLNEHLTGKEVVALSKEERIRLGTLSPDKLRDTFINLKEGKYKANVDLVKNKNKVPLHPAAEGKAKATIFNKNFGDSKAVRKEMKKFDDVPLHPAAEGKKAVSNIFNKKGTADFLDEDALKASTPASRKAFLDSLKSGLARAKTLGDKREISDLKKQIKEVTDRFDNKGQAELPKLSPEQVAKMEEAKKGMRKIFNKSAGVTPKIFKRKSKELGKIAEVKDGIFQGKVTKGPFMRKGEPHFELTNNKNKKVVVPRKGIKISYKQESKAAPVFKPAVNPMAKPVEQALSSNERARLAFKHKALQKEIIKLSGEKKNFLELKNKKKLYAEIGKKLSSSQDKSKLTSRSKARLERMEDMPGYEVFNKLKDKSGELRVGYSRKDMEKMKTLSLQIIAKAKVLGIPTSEYMKKHSNISAKDMRKLTPFIDEWATIPETMQKAVVSKTKVGNTQVGKLAMTGDLSAKEAAAIYKAGKQANIQNKTLTAKMRGKGATPTTFKMADEIAGLDEASSAAISDVPVNKIRGLIAKHEANPKQAANELFDDITDLVEMNDKLGKFFSRGLQARKTPAALNDVIAGLTRIRENLSGPDQIRAGEIIDSLKKSKVGNLRKAYDVFHEIAINNMLSAAMTISHNISGTSISAPLMVTDKIAAATVSALIPKKYDAILGGTRSYYREVIPMIKGMLQATPSSVKNGVRYFAFEDTRGVVKHLGRKIKKIRTQRQNVLNQRIRSGVEVSPEQTAKEIAKVHKRIEKAITDVKRIYTQESASRLEEVLPTGKRTIKGTVNPKTGKMDNPQKVLNAIGYAVNSPSRSLVAQDKAFAGAYYGGQQLASKTRKAIRNKVPLKYVASEEVAVAKIKALRKSIRNNPDNAKLVAMANRDIKRYRTLKLNAAEEEAVKDAALYYVFRQKLPKNIGKIQEAIVDIPGINTTFPFLKSNFNFVRYSLDHSPLGALGLKKSGAKTMDATQAGRIISGTAAWTYAYNELKKRGAEFYGTADSREERNLLRETGRKEKRIEFKDKDNNVTGQFEFGNLFPLTHPALAFTAWDERKRNLKKGMNEGEADTRAGKNFVLGLLKDSPYSSLDQAIKAIDHSFSVYDTYGTDGAQAGALSGGKKFVNRWLSGRLVPNLVREVTQEGKLFGLKVKEPDRTVYNPATFVQEVLSVLPIGKKNKKGIPTFMNFKGEESQRLPRYSFLNKKFYTGRAISEDKVLDALYQLEAFPKTLGKTTSLGPVKRLYLTDKERSDMIKKIGPKLYTMLDRVVSSPGFKSGMDDLARHTLLKKTISLFNTYGYGVTKRQAYKRLLTTEEGRKAIKYKATKGFSTTPSVFKKRR